LHIDYKIVHALADMAICDIVCPHRQIAEERSDLHKRIKTAMLNRKTQQPALIINSQAINLTMQIRSKKPYTLITTKNNKVATTTFKPSHVTVPIRHDYNVPIYIFGEIQSFTCQDQMLTECHLIKCQHLHTLHLPNNKVKDINLLSTLPALQSINLLNNAIQEESIRALINAVEPVEADLFTSHKLHTNLENSTLSWLAQQKGWKISNK